MNVLESAPTAALKAELNRRHETSVVHACNCETHALLTFAWNVLSDKRVRLDEDNEKYQKLYDEAIRAIEIALAKASIIDKGRK